MENLVSSILILKAKPESLKLSEQFLRNRGWQIYTANSLKSLIVNLAQRQPQYLLIPADFPHKKVQLLPSVLSQAFPVKIIVYAEQTTSASTAKLQEVKSNYRLYPPVSGPAVERIIFKIQRDDITREEQSETQRQNSSGGGKGSSEFEIRIQQDQAYARGALTALLREEDHEASNSSASSANFVQGANSDKEKNTSPAIQNIGSGADHPFEAGDFEGAVPFYGNRGLNFDGPKRQNLKKPLQPKFYNEIEFNLDKVTEALKSAHVLKPNQGASNLSDASPKTESVGFKNTGIRTPSSEPLYRFKSKEKVSNETIMVRGTERALEETVFLRSGPVAITQVKSTKNSACIIIESQKFSGYLVAAMGSNRHFDENFIDLVRERLFGFLKAHGEVIQDGEKAMKIKLQEIEFDDWALDQADFLKRAIHDDTEIAMAFFPSHDTAAKLEQSVSEKMLQLDIGELRDDVALDFDLYLYLPENKKYLLYTPEGRPLYGSQKNRLSEKGVSKMHLRKESAQGVKRYRAQLFLNDKIAEFKIKKIKTK